MQITCQNELQINYESYSMMFNMLKLFITPVLLGDNRHDLL